MTQHDTWVARATARHAAWYLRDAQALALDSGPRAAAEAFERVASSAIIPGRAIGLARQALRSANYDIAAAIKDLEK